MLWRCRSYSALICFQSTRLRPAGSFGWLSAVGAAWRRIGLSPLRLDREPESAAGKRVQIAVKAKKAIQRNGKKDNLSSGGRQGGVFGTTLPASTRQTDFVHNPIFSHFYNAEKANEITRQYFPRELLLSSPGSGGETAVVWFTGLDEDYVFGSCLVGGDSSGCRLNRAATQPGRRKTGPQ